MHCTTTFHLYLISLHIETKVSCFKGVIAFSSFTNCHSIKEIRKTIKKWFWRALASILRVFAVLFPHKNDEKRTVYELSGQKF